VTDPLGGILRDLYSRQCALLPHDTYFQQHAADGFVAGTMRVFRFYEPYLPRTGRILDWGCHHAPDACLMRAALGDGVDLYGCDVMAEGVYPLFYEYAGLHYARLTDPVRTPYEDGAFDAVVASGVLEHVPMDYESLKEVYRILRPGGRLIVTYLPNRESIEEWRLRRRDPIWAHQRLYGLEDLRGMLLHTGFKPLVAGRQTQLDLLAPEGSAAVLRPLLRLFGMHRFAACLCAVAEKTTSF
jgi:SAM-dependent methyltransferase